MSLEEIKELSSLSFIILQKYNKETVVIKMRRIVSFLICFVLIVTGCGKNSGVGNKMIEKEKFMDFKVYIDNNTLEKLGFENFTRSEFRLLFTEEAAYILNRVDKAIIKYCKGKKHKVYKASGQGPEEFGNPINLFFINDNNIAVFDNMNYKLMIFDKDLNFSHGLDCRIKQVIHRINKVRDGYIVFGAFGKEATGMFSLLDKDFNIKFTYGDDDRKTKYSNFYKLFLYNGYLMKDYKVADTSWIYLKKKCSVDIVDIKLKKKICNLSWDNPVTVSQKAINNRRMYGSAIITGNDNYYFVQNVSFEKRNNSFVDLIVFDKTGKLRKQYNDFKYYLLDTRYYKKKDDGKVYFLDEEGNILSGEVIQK